MEFNKNTPLLGKLLGETLFVEKIFNNPTGQTCINVYQISGYGWHERIGHIYKHQGNSKKPFYRATDRQGNEIFHLEFTLKDIKRKFRKEGKHMVSMPLVEKEPLLSERLKELRVLRQQSNVRPSITKDLSEGKISKTQFSEREQELSDTRRNNMERELRLQR